MATDNWLMGRSTTLVWLGAALVVLPVSPVVVFVLLALGLL